MLGTPVHQNQLGMLDYLPVPDVFGLGIGQLLELVLQVDMQERCNNVDVDWQRTYLEGGGAQVAVEDRGRPPH